MPGWPGTIFDAWRGDQPRARLVGAGAGEEVRLGALGSGSDYTVFLDHLGIPALDMGFSSGNGVYHSRYDTHWFFTHFGDPGFAYGVKLAELVGTFLERMANADVLPLDYASTAETVDRYLDQLEREAQRAKLDVDLSAVRRANARFGATATALNAEVQRVLALDPAVLARSAGALARLNDALEHTEEGFLSPQGPPQRP